jgi:hypothetical protein
MKDDESAIDREVSGVMASERQRGRGKGPIDPARKRKEKALAAELLKSKEAGDERGFSDALRRAGIREGSEVWKNAWKAFRS